MKVLAIHLAPGTRLAVKSVDAVTAEAGKGLVGDRYHGTRNRQVTIQSQEFLDRAAADLGYAFDPGATRRNITVDAGEIPTRPGGRGRVTAPGRLGVPGTDLRDDPRRRCRRDQRSEYRIGRCLTPPTKVLAAI